MEEVYKICHKSKISIWEISNFGNIKRNGKIHIPNESKGGYLRTSFNLIHRLVAEAFIPNPDNKPHVDHIDGNKHNNRYDNLRWVTMSENMLNDITRRRNSKAQQNYWNNEETRQKRSNEKKLYYINHPETRQKMSESAKKRKRLRGKYMTDGIDTYYVDENHWGEFIDIGFSFLHKSLYKRNTYKNIK